jgi:hypothetical protein
VANDLDISNVKTVGASRAEMVNTAFQVEQDFRRLVDTLKRSIASVDKSDEELIFRLTRTKVVADRGLRLSRLLLNFTRQR